MEKNMKIEDLNTSIWNQEFNAFLNLLNLEGEFTGLCKGVITDKNHGGSIGKSKVLSSIRDDNSLTLSSDFMHSYGGVRIRLELKDYPTVLHYQINRENSLQLHGTLKGHLEDNQFMVDYFDMTTRDQVDKLQKFSLLTNGNDFYYHDYRTDNKIIFRKASYFAKQEGMSLSMDYTSLQKEHLRAIVSASCDNSHVQDVHVYNRSNGECPKVDALENYLSVTDPIADQFASVFITLGNRYYDRIGEIIDTYQYQGINMVENAISNILLPSITKEQSECIFGKRLVKEISSSK